MTNQVKGILAVIALGLILFLLIPPDVIKLVFFIAFSVGLVYCFIKIRNTTNFWWDTIAYIIGLIISIFVTLNLTKYFAENYVWVSVTIAIIMCIVALSFIIFASVFIIKGIYNFFKERNKSVN
jgi:hypothetical protein